MTKAKTKRPRFTATAEHNLGVALADASEALIAVRGLYKDLQAHGSMIHALEEAICPRVAARLTALEKMNDCYVSYTPFRAALERLNALERQQTRNAAQPAKPALPEGYTLLPQPNGGLVALFNGKVELHTFSEQYAIEWCIEDAKKRAKPTPSEAEISTWTAATALSQEQLGRMIQSLQRVYWKKRLATEK